ncbi:A/G-specific adenine glycosylase [Holophaga foetida]|uniref:A/G-specific adenine glycosylase n=1 Tax=Holophaga foetida TaxID=35839 RepID=UPI0002471CD2|nr:A/G-specific adenine glycosylase [Holophaga foetida]
MRRKGAEEKPEASAILTPLVSWFEAHRRVLPWRALDLDQPHPDPYAVLVSELMLQQTQVVTVVPYFERWMLALPTVRALAEAPEQQIHKLWEGLGYYRRARFLQAAARSIHEQGWPADLEGLLALPGLGPYTAAAIASIAFQWPEPALDGNAFRVLARLLGIETDPKDRGNELRTWLRPALTAHGPSRMTQALMELGATHCSKRAQCDSCPLETDCRSRAAGTVDHIPLVAPRAKVRSVEITLIAIQTAGQYLVNIPAPDGLLAGLWSWALREEIQPQDLKAAEAARGYRAVEIKRWKGWTQVYSHRREQVTPLLLEVEEPFPPTENQCWVSAQELRALPMGRRDQRLRDLVLQSGEDSHAEAAEKE